MNENFDYKKSLIGIKANLFDIYENQEKVIGTIDSSVMEKHVSDFIEIKNIAVTLINKIESLYNNSVITEKNISDDAKLPITQEPELPKVSETNQDDAVVKESELDDIETSENDSDEIESDAADKEDSEIEFGNDSQENAEKQDDEIHLLCDEDKLHFAYVSEGLLEKLKNYNNNNEIENNLNEIEIDKAEDTNIDNNIYKKDNLPVKGIIVRSDQYMKLALSKHRQEGVLEEAKAYRIETTRKKRKEIQKQELEKAKVHIDI